MLLKKKPIFGKYHYLSDLQEADKAKTLWEDYKNHKKSIQIFNLPQFI